MAVVDIDMVVVEWFVGAGKLEAVAGPDGQAENQAVLVVYMSGDCCYYCCCCTSAISAIAELDQIVPQVVIQAVGIEAAQADFGIGVGSFVGIDSVAGLVVG